MKNHGVVFPLMVINPCLDKLRFTVDVWIYMAHVVQSMKPLVPATDWVTW
jgi:hypothetical protein